MKSEKEEGSFSFFFSLFDPLKKYYHTYIHVYPLHLYIHDAKNQFFCVCFQLYIRILSVSTMKLQWMYQKKKQNEKIAKKKKLSYKKLLIGEGEREQMLDMRNEYRKESLYDVHIMRDIQYLILHTKKKNNFIAILWCMLALCLIFLCVHFLRSRGVYRYTIFYYTYISYV